MAKENLYIADSGIDPSPHTPAQEAFFRWRYAAGSLQYADEHGTKEEARALLQETSELYDIYAALRDGRQRAAPLPISESSHDSASPCVVAEPLAPSIYKYASRNGRGARVQALGEELLARYDAYRALRDARSVSYDIVAGGAPDQEEPNPTRDRPPLQPNELPPELAEFLAGQERASLLHETDQGTVFVTRLPRRDIESLRGQLPVQVRHELYDHPLSPVIRTVVTWYDQPATPLAMETFTNPGDVQQRSEFFDLSARTDLRFLFYDETLGHQLSKVVPNRDQEIISQITTTADDLLARIPGPERDFDRAKAEIVARTTL